MAGNNSNPTAIDCYCTTEREKNCKTGVQAVHLPYSEYKTLKNYL